MNTEKKRVLICEFHQESNTFNPKNAQLADFYVDTIPEGWNGYQIRKSTPCAVHGMIDALEAAGVEVIPSLFLSAPSGGRVEDAVLDVFFQKLDTYLAAAGTLDAVCVSLHGATCMVSDDDACGTLLKQLRSRLGNICIAASFDLHANITDTILENADIICGYQTYPHTDQYETGHRAASLCIKLLKGEHLLTAEVAVPVLLPPAGYNSLAGAFGELIAAANTMVKEGKLLDYTIFPVQPWLDINKICSRVVTIAADETTAKACAATLSQALLAHRDAYSPPLMSIDAVIDFAEANATGNVVVLADAADSPNGGAVGDSPAVALRLLARGSKLRTGMFVVDPDAVRKAFEVGIGGCAEFTVGAGFTPGIPGPLQAMGTVISLHDGQFCNEGPADRGTLNYLGLSAVVRFGSIDILLCHRGSSTGDPQIFRHFGIEPTLYDLIVVKANTSFRVPYSKFTDLICYADTPGAGASNLKQLHWQQLPKGMYPFDLPENDTLPEAKIRKKHLF